MTIRFLCLAGEVDVTYYPEHTGHTCDVAHTTMTKHQREQIVSRLLAGVPVDDVLDSIHTTESTSGVSNLQRVTRKDVLNVAREFGLNRGVILHANDADNVAAWIQRTGQDESTWNLVRVGSEQEPEIVQPALPDISESDAIMIQLCDTQAKCDTTAQITTAELAWNDVRKAMENDIRVATVVSEHMTRLNALVHALANAPEVPRLPMLPQSAEPGNKKAAVQRQFRSTRKPSKRKQQVTASKPTRDEKKLLLQSLSGETSVMSTQPLREHDYSCDTSSHVVHF